MGTLGPMPFLLPFFMRVLHRARRGFRRPVSPCARCSKARPASRQSGASVIEFSLVAVPLLLVGLGSIEVAHWLLARQAVSLALLQAARAGTTDHGRPATIENALEHALLPLFPGGSRRSASQAQAAAFAQRLNETGGAPWQIEILSPTAAAFDDFADPAIAAGGHPATLATPPINNNYQLEQHRRHVAAGWPDGLGPRSGQSIFEANTLVLRLRYLHEPVLPGIKNLLRLLGNEGGTYGQRAMARGGYLPITRDIALTMESHPMLWPLPANGKFVAPQSQQTMTGRGIASCTGWWCPRQARRPGSSPGKPAPGNPAPGSTSGSAGPSGGTASSSPATGSSAPGSPTSGSAQSEGGSTTVDDALAVAPDDPACGVALCCVAG